MPSKTAATKYLEKCMKKPKCSSTVDADATKPAPTPVPPPPPTPEEKAARDKKLALLEARKKAIEASNAAIQASYPKKEIVVGSPYQAAREAWINGQAGTDGAFDHWTASK
jgi:hypothetical protein